MNIPVSSHTKLKHYLTCVSKFFKKHSCILSYRSKDQHKICFYKHTDLNNNQLTTRKGKLVLIYKGDSRECKHYNELNHFFSLTSTTFDVVLSIPHYEICSSDAHICTFGEGQNDQVKWELLMPPKPTAMHRKSHRCVAEVLNQWHDLPLCMHTVAVHRSLLAYIISCSFVSSLIYRAFHLMKLFQLCCCSSMHDTTPYICMGNQLRCSDK